ncbi:MAG: peptidoglycan DD-metalloendopeptidase family protein [bacterium]|nr:peptidoglycan DD-metalloendopeptidase family protein [bacterium]
MAGVDQNSLLYSLVSGEEIITGPLDPSAYAQSDAPGIGGARLAVADGGLGVDIITFDDPEVDFAATLGGNAVIAPLIPIVPEPGSDSMEDKATAVSHKPQVYTVEDGDTIASIAAKFNISTNTVLWANGLSSRDVIKVGDHLTILPTTGVLHTVKSGDTLSGIGEKYDVKIKDIIEYNSLDADGTLSIGQKLIIPDGYIEQSSSSPVIIPRDSSLADGSSGPTPEPAKISGSGLLWPTTTKHISQYFIWGHTGIDIDNRSKPPVYAAGDGKVEFAGWLGGYGNLMIVNHGNGLQTYYAHLEKLYVSKGAMVSKGAAIAKMGSTGRSTGPHLHFEVRRSGRPINPLGMF